MSPKAAPRLLTSAEAMELLRVKPTSFYDLVARGELAVIRIPTVRGKKRELRVEATEIDAFIERNRTARAS